MDEAPVGLLEIISKHADKIDISDNEFIASFASLLSFISLDISLYKLIQNLAYYLELSTNCSKKIKRK